MLCCCRWRICGYCRIRVSSSSLCVYVPIPSIQLYGDIGCVCLAYDTYRASEGIQFYEMISGIGCFVLMLLSRFNIEYLYSSSMETFGLKSICPAGQMLNVLVRMI